MDYEDAWTFACVVAYSPTTKDRQGREGEWVTIKLWGEVPQMATMLSSSIRNGSLMRVKGSSVGFPVFRTRQAKWRFTC